MCYEDMNEVNKTLQQSLKSPQLSETLKKKIQDIFKDEEYLLVDANDLGIAERAVPGTDTENQ